MVTETLTKESKITITVDNKGLKELLVNYKKEDLLEILTEVIVERHDIIAGVVETIEDIVLAKKTEEGLKTKTIDNDKFMKDLESRIKE